MRSLFLFFLVLVTNATLVQAKIGNTFEENAKDYGNPIETYQYSDKHGFGGYATYQLDPTWKIKAFLKDNKVRSEYLMQIHQGKGSLSRDEVRDRALKMFDQPLRGAYKREIKQAKVEGHFFEKGLIAYEYILKGKSVVGYQAIKVMLYENNANFSSINPKACI